MSGARIKVIGHRGAAGHAPENTFAAFDKGIELGVDGVETDIRATKDGTLILLHDATVDRTTDGTGPIAEMTLEEAERLNAAARFKDGQHDFGVQRIPTLDDFLNRYGGRTTFRLEIKQRGVESAALRAVRARRLMDTAVFTSFQIDSLRAIRRAAPEAQIAYLSSARVFDDSVIQTALDAGANEVAPRAELADPAMLEKARAAGL
ncbi:MAG TPA: glycerophosphodiester phosphodiesterase family protein, partial [Gemmatimonadales bacterium]|nr:glycerophosphodiester phosphodiesterase family protein [Gemmatimonadales bacterium]